MCSCYLHSGSHILLRQGEYSFELAAYTEYVGQVLCDPLHVLSNVLLFAACDPCLPLLAARCDDPVDTHVMTARRYGWCDAYADS